MQSLELSIQNDSSWKGCPFSFFYKNGLNYPHTPDEESLFLTLFSPESLNQLVFLSSNSTKISSFEFHTIESEFFLFHAVFFHKTIDNKRKGNDFFLLPNTREKLAENSSFSTSFEAASRYLDDTHPDFILFDINEGKNTLLSSNQMAEIAIFLSKYISFFIPRKQNKKQFQIISKKIDMNANGPWDLIRTNFLFFFFFFFLNLCFLLSACVVPTVFTSLPIFLLSLFIYFLSFLGELFLSSRFFYLRNKRGNYDQINIFSIRSFVYCATIAFTLIFFLCYFLIQGKKTTIFSGLSLPMLFFSFFLIVLCLLIQSFFSSNHHAKSKKQ